MQIVEPEHRSGRNKYKDHKEREYFSLGMTREPVCLEQWQGLRKRAERLLGTNPTGPLAMVMTMDFSLSEMRSPEGFLVVKWQN